MIRRFVVQAARVLDVEISRYRLAGVHAKGGTTLPQNDLCTVCLHSHINPTETRNNWQDGTLELDRSAAGRQGERLARRFVRQLRAQIAARPIQRYSEYDIR